MTLTIDHLHQLLTPRPFRFHGQVHSTQDLALAWLREGAKTGSVVIGDEQITGRGRHGRGWSTPPGVAIAMSVILRPPKHGLGQVTMLGALAIAQMLDHYGAESVGIKWPNDVRLNGRKVCGVLPEAIWDGDRLLGVSLGMGINVRNDFSDTPLANTAISIEQALGVTVDRAEVIKQVLDRVDFWSPQLGHDALFAAWRDRLETLGQQVTITNDAGVFTGLAESVDSDGALLLRDADGHQQRIIAGDVALGHQ